MGIYRNSASYLYSRKPEFILPEKPPEEDRPSPRNEIRIPKSCKTIEEIKAFIFLSLQKEILPNRLAKALKISNKATSRILRILSTKNLVSFTGRGLVSLRPEIVQEYLIETSVSKDQT